MLGLVVISSDQILPGITAGEISLRTQQKRIDVCCLTLITGVACLADAALQTALALVLSTSAFLIATTAVHIAAVVGIVLGVLLLFWIKSIR